jgi:hypothetical protein
MRSGRSAGVGATPWVQGDGTCHRGWAEAVGRVRVAAGRAWGVYDRVVTCQAVLAQCGVGHAWTLGMVRRQVVLSGLLIQWPSGALGCYCV